MRKIITSLTLLFFGFAPLLSNAQNISLRVPQTHLTSDTSTAIDASAIVINTGTSPITIKATRRIVSLANGHLCQFCWGGTCFSPATNVSPLSEIIAPGDSSVDFTGNVLPYSTLGSDVVYYVFYDINNLADSAWVTFSYDFVAATGIKEMGSSGNFLNCTQSITEDATNITYKISNFRDAKLVIRSLTGAAVKEIRLNDKQGVLSVSTNSLPAGIYMYALYNNDEPVAMKKMVIWRR